MRISTTSSTSSLLLIFVCAAGCTDGLPAKPEAEASRVATESAREDDAPDAGPASEIPAFDPPPLAAGYMRLEAPPLDVPTGLSEDWAQWVGGPLDQDYDVLDITGAQSAGGHHALLYATADENPIGFTRVWRDADQLSTRLMGGIGGEGGANARLPPGVVFRVQKGSYLVMQTHFLNAYGKPLIGRSVLDIKLAPVDRSRRVASILSSTTPHVSLPPGERTVIDVSCQVQEDLHFIQIANHMHGYGKSVFTEFTDPSGLPHELKSDPAWSGEWALNPNFSHFPVAAPRVVPKGSTLHTRCTFANPTATPIDFPSEMCVFFGFMIGESDIFCSDGKWSVTSRPVTDESTSDTGAGNMADEAGCQTNGDQTIMSAATFAQQSTDCSLSCAFDTDVASCTARCFEKDVGLSAGCARCNGTNVACGAKNCLSLCAADPASESCRSCVSKNCDAAFRACAGS